MCLFRFQRVSAYRHLFLHVRKLNKHINFSNQHFHIRHHKIILEEINISGKTLVCPTGDLTIYGSIVLIITILRSTMTKSIPIMIKCEAWKNHTPCIGMLCSLKSTKNTLKSSYSNTVNEKSFELAVCWVHQVCGEKFHDFSITTFIHV